MKALVIDLSRLENPNQKEEKRNKINSTTTLKYLSKRWIQNKLIALLYKRPNVNLNPQIKILVRTKILKTLLHLGLKVLSNLTRAGLSFKLQLKRKKLKRK
jgi:hypothetical protein